MDEFRQFDHRFLLWSYGYSGSQPCFLVRFLTLSWFLFHRVYGNNFNLVGILAGRKFRYKIVTMIDVSVIHSEEQLQDNLCKIKVLQVLRPVLLTFLVLSLFLEILFYWNPSWQIEMYVYDIILIANIFNWVNCISMYLLGRMIIFLPIWWLSTAPLKVSRYSSSDSWDNKRMINGNTRIYKRN